MSSVESPCVRNCCLNDDDICLGCFRSMQEIMQWGQADDELRQQILSLAKERESKSRHKCNIDQVQEI